MSSLYVRQKVKQWVEALSIPFYDTSNVEQNPTDAVWCTIDWEPAGHEKLTYCGHLRESGSFSVVFLTPAGGGDEALLLVAEPLMDLFMANTDSRLCLLLRDPPEDELRTGNDAPLYAAAFRVEYELYGG